MSQYTPGNRQRLVRLVMILGSILLVLCFIAGVLTLTQPEPPATNPPASSTVGPVAPGSSTGGTDPLPTTVPGTTAAPVQPTDPAVTTAPTDPSDPTQPDSPTTPPATPPTTPPTQPKEPVDLPSFFSESAFIGDSVTLKLRNYCMTHTELGRPTFLCAGSYAVRHALKDPDPDDKNLVSITYQGEAMRPEDAIKQSGVKRVFIMLGMNDIAFGIDKTITNWDKLVKNIRQECPDVEIYIQSGTPIWIGGEKGKLNNENMDAYNVKLQAFAQENGCHYIDVASYLKDENGGLKTEYVSDSFVHLTDKGCKAWIQALSDYLNKGE